MVNIVQRPNWNSLGELQQSINELFPPLFRSYATDTDNTFLCDWSPHVDIKEEDKQYIIHAHVLGINPQDTDISMENGLLTIRGEKETQREDKDKEYIHYERSKGTFLRRFSLPQSIAADKIKAKCKNGVLELIIPKVNQEGSHKITVEG